MKFYISGQWPVPDLLPASHEATSARDALRQYRQFVRFGMTCVKAFKVNEENDRVLLSLWRLRDLASREARAVRNGISSALLSMIAAALANSFGDFGTVSNTDSRRVARSSQSRQRPRQSRNRIDMHVASLLHRE
jgi:hypothetical protein